MKKVKAWLDEEFMITQGWTLGIFGMWATTILGLGHNVRVWPFQIIFIVLMSRSNRAYKKRSKKHEMVP